MAESAVTKTVGHVTNLEFANMCPCEDVSFGENEGKSESIQGPGCVTVLRNIPVQGRAMYYFVCKTQMQKDPPEKMWSTVEVSYAIKQASGDTKYAMFAKMNHVRQADGWVDMGGDFVTMDDAVSVTINLTVKTDGAEISVDPASRKLSHILENPDWRAAADRRIQLIRKGNITLRIKVPEQYEPDKLSFQLTEQKSSFPWGSAVDKGHLSGKSLLDQKFRQFLSEYFTWATPGNEVKWRLMEKQEGRPIFTSGDICLDVLQSAGIKVRGHCLMWARTRVIPSWLSPKPPKEVEENVYRRLKYCAEHFSDRFSHWDVNNEQLHEAWYAEKLQQPDFLSRIFKYFHELQPSLTLFVNDFFVFGGGLMTQSYKQQVRKLLKDNAPIGAVGIQSHISGYENISLFLKRLEVLSENGVPLWLTEFDVNLKDKEQQTQMYEDLIRLCFSHPSIHGIVFWGFVNNLVDAETMELNDAGKRLHKLWRKEWWTQETLLLPSGTKCAHQVELTTGAFQGSYLLTAQYKEQSIWKKEFEVKPMEDLVIDVKL